MDILELLKQYGVELPTEKVEEFNKSFRKAYKSEAELKKVSDKASITESELATLKEQHEAVKAELGTISTAKSTFETELNTLKRVQLEEATKSLYDGALKGVEFVSDRVRKTILDELKAKNLEQKDGKLEGVDTYLQELYTSDKAIFKTVDSTIHTWGSESNKNSGNGADNKTPADMFGRIL